jgi:hypothetical protein
MIRLLCGAAALAFPLAAAVADTSAAFAQSAASTQSTQAGTVNRDAQIAAQFTARINAYMDMHAGLENTLPKLSKDSTPEEIDKHQRALGRLIAEARRGARPGDIFTRDTRALFRRHLAAVFGGPDGRQLKTSIMDENPGPVRIAVNQRYPDEIPLTTMPPQVLEWLPKLPEELEYRFIDDRLILLDVHAHMIVDIIDNALPR